MFFLNKIFQYFIKFFYLFTYGLLFCYFFFNVGSLIMLQNLSPEFPCLAQVFPSFNPFFFYLFRFVEVFYYTDSFSYQLDGIIAAHNFIFIIICVIVVFVFFIIFFVYYDSIFGFFTNNFFFIGNHTSFYNFEKISLDVATIKTFPKTFPKDMIDLPNNYIRHFFSMEFLNFPKNITPFFNYSQKLLKIINDTILEVVWTLIPMFILLFIAIPSFSLLYALEENYDSFYSIKIIGNQWFWTYEIASKSFDSNLIKDSDLSLGQFRLLEVDNPLFLPLCISYRFLITSADVLHCWTVPALGIKVDACPGRLNIGYVNVKVAGIAYGQCSEICGIGHGFMPICVYILPEILFSL